MRETMPHEANVVSQRLSTPLFGLFLLYYKMCIALVSSDSTTIVDTYAIGGGTVAQLTSKKPGELGYVSAFLSSGTDRIKIIVELKIELAWVYFLQHSKTGNLSDKLRLFQIALRFKMPKSPRSIVCAASRQKLPTLLRTKSALVASAGKRN